MRSVIGLKPVAPRVSQVVGCLSGDSAAGSRGNPCERRHRPTARVHKTVRSAVVAFWGKDENLPCMARASGAGRTTAADSRAPGIASTMVRCFPRDAERWENNAPYAHGPE